MRKIIFYGAVSLDGYLATKTDDLQWLFDTPTGEQTTYEDFYETMIRPSWAGKLIKKQKDWRNRRNLSRERVFPFFEPMHNYNYQ